MRDALVLARDVDADYDEGARAVPVLRGASFALERGALTAVTGASGSGKTTLLSLVGGLDRPRRGSIVVAGDDIATCSRAALSTYRRLKVGFVFQAFHLLPHLTASENVASALAPLRLARAERGRRVAEALERVGLHALGTRFPQQLSGGEQQRVAVARACVKDPPLLLADEPTGNLDDESAGPVLELIRGERGRRTVLLVTHDADVAAGADRRLLVAHHAVSTAS
jgi:putative ABC transport system ATP-binding protein